MGSITVNMNIRTQKALTLTELLVSTILIAIVMVGVASFSFVIKQLQSTTDKSGLLSMRLAAAMNRMGRDALLTVGDPASPGIQTYSNAGTRSICFRNDVNDPLTYADDKWTCYFYDSGGTNILKRCENLDPSSIPPAADVQCDAALDVQTFLPLSNINFFNVVYNAADVRRLDYIEITLTGRYDITKAAHVIENPEQVVTIQISPPNYGR